MSTYYRTTDQQLVQLTAEQYGRLAPSKHAVLRPYRVDPEPTPSSTQYVVRGPVVVTETEARLTWALIEKTAQQLADEAFSAERAADLQLLRTAYLGLKNSTGTNAERITRCERVLVRLLKDIYGGEPA